eukprot:5087898-Pyramimonas_sp.AAC.1
MMTKHLACDTIDFYMDLCGFVILEGRSELSLKAAVLSKALFACWSTAARGRLVEEECSNTYLIIR